MHVWESRALVALSSDLAAVKVTGGSPPLACLGNLYDAEQTGLDRVVEPGADEAQATSLGRFSGRRPWSVFGSPPGKGTSDDF